MVVDSEQDGDWELLSVETSADAVVPWQTNIKFWVNGEPVSTRTQWLPTHSVIAYTLNDRTLNFHAAFAQ